MPLVNHRLRVVAKIGLIGFFVILQNAPLCYADDFADIKSSVDTLDSPFKTLADVHEHRLKENFLTRINESVHDKYFRENPLDFIACRDVGALLGETREQGKVHTILVVFSDSHPTPARRRVHSYLGVIIAGLLRRSNAHDVDEGLEVYESVETRPLLVSIYLLRKGAKSIFDLAVEDGNAKWNERKAPSGRDTGVLIYSPVPDSARPSAGIMKQAEAGKCEEI